MSKRVGRKKKVKVTKIAFPIECNGEYCGNCEKAIREEDNPADLICKFFRVELTPAKGDLKAERCSSCHMAERYANGEAI